MKLSKWYLIYSVVNTVVHNSKHVINVKYFNQQPWLVFRLLNMQYARINYKCFGLNPAIRFIRNLAPSKTDIFFH